MIENKLCNEDFELSRRMSIEYQSENEREFFQRIRYKEEHEYTFSNDLIMHELDNEDRILILRSEYEEYIVSRVGVGGKLHFMCLAEALQEDLGKAGLVADSITLLDWLRRRDYAGVKYDGNYDNR